MVVELSDVLELDEKVWRWVWPVLLATLATQGPMPWVPAAVADDIQLLTAWVTTEPWLVLVPEPELEVSLDVSLEVSVEVSVPVVVSVETTVWC